jgi:hypothetical protein
MQKKAFNGPAVEAVLEKFEEREFDCKYVRLKGSSLGRTDLQPRDSRTRKPRSRCMEREGEAEAARGEGEGELLLHEDAASVGREERGVGLFDDGSGILKGSHVEEGGSDRGRLLRPMRPTDLWSN